MLAQEVAPKEYFECALGTDSSMRIKYTRTRTTAALGPRNLFGAPVKTSTFTAETVIENKNSFSVTDLIIHDALPIASEDGVTVELKRPDGLADARGDQLIEVDKTTKLRWSKLIDGKGGETEGKYEWLVTVNAGKSITLKAKWEVRSPEMTTYEEVPQFL